MPPSDAYRPDPAWLRLGDGLHDAVTPAHFPQHLLRFRNDRAAADVGLDTLSDPAWIDHFARFTPLPGNLPEPLALRYHGHQFRHYNPNLGDGRGFLYAQVRDRHGVLLDLGTKGSGTTPWSRGGDGRLTLKGAVREILATEYLEALGVDTSRTLSVVETGESLERHDEPSPTRAAVLVRLQRSHVRFGTFQRLAFHREHALLERLVGFTLQTWFPDDADASDPASTLLDRAVSGMARTVGGWMAAGFVHGVLNTDNMCITGQSFDYGPWRWAMTYDPGFTAAYFDDTGLYAFGRQPEAVHWNLVRLAEALLPVGDREALTAALHTYVPRVRRAWGDAVRRRLGIASAGAEEDERRATALVSFLGDTGLPMEQVYFDLYGGPASRDRRARSPLATSYAAPAFDGLGSWIDAAQPDPQAHLDHAVFDEGPVTMAIETVEALWDPIAVHDDWSALHTHVAAVRRYGEALAGTLCNGPLPVHGLEDVPVPG